MAHWIIDDHGFGGQYYQCSECGTTFYYAPDDICPHCGAEINDDENEYVEDAKNTSLTTTDELMSNQKAAAIIKEMIAGSFVVARGSTKTTGLLMRIAALCKAVEVLEGTSDVQEETDL